MCRWPGSLPRRYLASFFRYRRPASYNGYKMRPRLCRPSKACEVDTPSPSLAMRHAPKRLLHNNLSHQRLTPTTHPAKTSAKLLPNGTDPRAISLHGARWPTVGVTSATTAQCPRLGSPVLQHFGPARPAERQHRQPGGRESFVATETRGLAVPIHGAWPEETRGSGLKVANFTEP